ncbi:membrane hypothetical protein [Nitrospina gracilis 3/211]|uniref:Uncharacterized protein n=1 Tax=Nitrospina gracilis (strain 3/211) TaxID=1266370 RepID=M1YLT6_NITG3|nr:MULTISPECIES: hypothetical protein [Nitrospina]MCF8724294.1 hypothetical protein [Nitrospina sp. Nb-3]CCQ91442.1 membrane hypothetical protein [Nitrospina gracilis 3/211]
MNISVNGWFKILGGVLVIKSLSGFYFLFHKNSVPALLVTFGWVFEVLSLALGVSFVLLKFVEITDVVRKNVVFALLITLITLFIFKSFYKYGLSPMGVF